ncbi:MAG: hypothetical protein N2712_07220 [Brevinematales bacterium]|nr:hypothetical protein [Brevinematales bacterium]
MYCRIGGAEDVGYLRIYKYTSYFNLLKSNKFVGNLLEYLHLDYLDWPTNDIDALNNKDYVGASEAEGNEVE